MDLMRDPFFVGLGAVGMFLVIYARVKRENLERLGESLDTFWEPTAIQKIDAL